MSATRTPEATAARKEPRQIVTSFEGLIKALERETEKLRAVDTYLNDEGKHRLVACENIQFLAAFCDTAADLEDMGLYDELGGDAGAVWDILMAIERIAKMEKGAKK